MALRKYKPITAGTRWRIGNAYAEVTTNVPEKSLLEKKSKTGGRNAQGRRSMRYIGDVRLARRIGAGLYSDCFDVWRFLMQNLS